MPFYRALDESGQPPADLRPGGRHLLLAAHAAANAVWPSFYGEMFSTQVRFSGLAIGTQLGFLVAGFAPAIVTALGGVREGGWVVTQHLHRGGMPIAAGSALTAARNPTDVPTELLGHRAAPDRRARPAPASSEQAPDTPRAATCRSSQQSLAVAFQGRHHHPDRGRHGAVGGADYRHRHRARPDRHLLHGDGQPRRGGSAPAAPRAPPGDVIVLGGDPRPRAANTSLTHVLGSVGEQ